MSRQDRPTMPPLEGTSLKRWQSLLLAARFARREMRTGVRGFMVFLACLSLGVAAIAGINSLSTSLVQSIAQEGQSILGADLRYSLIHREASKPELKHLESLGALSISASMRAMARLTDGSDQTLTELKSVDQAYPLYGKVALGQSTNTLQELLKKQADGSYGGVAEPAFMARLGLKIGSVIDLGTIKITIKDLITREPDRLSGSVGFGPRLLISNQALKASSLVQPGSLVHWHYNVRLKGEASAGDVAALRLKSEEAFPKAGWEIRTRENASPGLARNIKRFAQFLTLVGLTALIVGGVGVANAVSAHLETKREAIATFKSIGASGTLIFATYMIQILMLATLAILLGLIIGSFVPIIAATFLKTILPVTLDTIPDPWALGFAALYGYLLAIIFALWPLSRAKDIPPTALFRDFETQRQWPKAPYLVSLIGFIIVLLVLAIGFSDNKKIASFFAGGTLFSFIILHFVALLIMKAAKRTPKIPWTALRLAIGNIHRPGAITPSVVLSLGLGLTLFVTIALIDTNLRNRLTDSIANEAPSFFFVDIQNRQIDAFENLIRQNVKNPEIERVPLMRGFFTEIAGKDPATMQVPGRSQWALRGDRGITYATDIPENSTLKTGTWWPKDYSGKPLVSFDEEIATDFGLKVGDTIKVNVLGREIEATVASTRTVEWQSLAINFVMVFSPNTFKGAPHAHLATLTYKDGADDAAEFALVRKISKAFPTVTTIRVKDALNRVAAVIGQLAWAIRGASAVTLLASVLVLAGALAAGHRAQIYDAVILKTLGATRRQLLTAYSLQFTLLGIITAFFGILAGTFAAWFVVTQMMEASFIFQPAAAFSAAFIALILCISLGLIGTLKLLSQKAAPILRNP